jgi:homoserine kinase
MSSGPVLEPVAGPVVVRAPATSANLGPGFDALGLALSLYDEVRAQVIESGLRIEVLGVGQHTAGFGEGHLVVRAMRALFGTVGVQPPGLKLRCVNAIPHGFGLGSSAAAIVSGMLAARALAGTRGAALSDVDMLALAAEFEGHADNVAACLAGGLTIAWSDRSAAAGGPVRCVRLEPMAGLVPVLCVPAKPLSTETARKILPAVVPHADAAKNAARAALLIAGLTGAASVKPADAAVAYSDIGAAGDPLPGPAAPTPLAELNDPSLAVDAGDGLAALLLDATRDYLHQPYRAESMPDSAALIVALRERGIPAVVSGAGPAVLALLVADAQASQADVAAIAGSSGKDWDVRVLAIDPAGATVRITEL